MPNLEQRLEQRRVSKNREQKKSLIKWVALFLAVFFLTLGVAFLWFSSGTLTGSKQKKADDKFLAFQDKINIMVMGVDERADDVGRSDTLMVLTIDTKTKGVSIISIPRDSRVKIPGHGYDKINHAYALGGHTLSKQAVELLLGVPIDHYVIVNIAGFKRIVDAVGGLDIDVEKRMYYSDPWDDDGGLVIDLQPGMQHLDGKTAIQYVRYRDEEGDIGRVERQQHFLRALLDQLASPGVIPRIPGIIQSVSNAVKSDLSTAEMLNLAKIIKDAKAQGLQSYMVPGKPAYIEDISYWLPDIVALRQHMAQVLGASASERYQATTRQEADEYAGTLPKNIKVVDAPKSPTKPNDTTRATEPVSPKTPTATGRIRVSIVNGSGSAAAGDRMAATLRRQGFDVVGVSFGSARSNTVVISNSNDNSVINRLNSLPFDYALQISRNEGGSTQATVIVGKDFAER